LKNLFKKQATGALEKNIALLLWATKRSIPLDAICDPDLQNYLQLCNVNQLPSRQTFTKLLFNVHNAIVEIVKLEMRDQDAISIQFDAWEAPAHQGKVLGLICRYITHDFQLKQHLIGAFPTVSGHYAEYLFAMISGCLSKWNNSKIFFTVSDNASNAAATGRKFGSWLGCTCHTIQLAVKDVLEGSDELIQLNNKVGEVVNYIRNHAAARFDLLSQQEEESKQLMVIADNDTRWLSKISMLKRYSELETYIDKSLGEGAAILGETQSKRAKKLYKLLEPIVLFTRLMEGNGLTLSQLPSSAYIIGILQGI
jgi:hypothetical protein